MEIDELIKRVDSKETFLEFVVALRVDWEASRAEESAHPSSPYGPDARGWENADLGRFLEAMHRWLESADNYYRNTRQSVDSSQPSWRLFADVLMAAKGYE